MAFTNDLSRFWGIFQCFSLSDEEINLEIDIEDQPVSDHWLAATSTVKYVIETSREAIQT